MPYKFETNKIKLPPELDRRRKLTEDDHEIIRRLYFRERTGIREIARRFAGKCSRRTIQFVLFPHRLKSINYPGHWKKYYDRKKQTKAIRKTRRYKQALIHNKLLT